MAIFDTSILIDYLKGRQKGVDAVERYGTDGIAITSVSSYELTRGIGSRGRELLRLLFGRVRIYTLDQDSAVAAGELMRKLDSKGTPIGDIDALVASIALSNNETLVTSDSDFERIGSGSIKVLK